MDVQCWLYDVSELYESATFWAAMNRLPWEERRDKVLRYKFAKDQCLSLGAGLVCAHALRAAGATDLSLGLGAYGKPYLLHHPSIHFNLSHSGTMAMCAVSSEPVGADVEARHDYEEGVSRLAFTDNERRWIKRRSDTTEGFTRMWVRKESYLKLQGTGLTDDVKAFDVAPGRASGHVSFCEHEYGGHYLCVCTPRPAQVTLLTLQNPLGLVTCS